MPSCHASRKRVACGKSRKVQRHLGRMLSLGFSNTALATPMESPHPDERPPKKRRFFAEDSSPAQVRSKPSNPAPLSPQQSPPSPIQTSDGTDGSQGPGPAALDGFDVGMLQAVVGELPSSTLQKLKDVSSSNVERGEQHQYFLTAAKPLYPYSNQSVPRWLMDVCACACTCACTCSHLPTPSSASPDNDSELPQAHRFRGLHALTKLRYLHSNSFHIEGHAAQEIHWLIWSRWLGHDKRDWTVEARREGRH